MPFGGRRTCSDSVFAWTRIGSKDAKYGVRGTDGRVALMYSTADGERWHMTTDAHPELADMVNDVKRTQGAGPRGPFYINEYKQVIVPVGDAAQYYFAGTYDLPLRFEFEGKTISGERSEEHTSELQSLRHLVCRLLLET